MTLDSVARLERAALCELLLAVGPDQPTLCAGWTTHDLAAHLVIRERRPDAAIGIVVPLLAGHTERVRAAAARRPFPELVALLRRPPPWSVSAVGPLDRAINTAEFFIHHEDVRRAAPGWQPRPLSREYGKALWPVLGRTARLALRRFRAGVRITAPGFGELTAGTRQGGTGQAGTGETGTGQAGTGETGTGQAGTGETVLHLTGDPGELTMFLSGRQSAARVELTGPAELTTRLRKARLGI